MSQARAPANLGRTFDRGNSCERKVWFTSYSDARRAAENLKRMEDEDEDCTLRPYRCNYCGRYHVGHRP